MLLIYHRLLLLLLVRAFLEDSTNQALVFGIFINFIANLSYNVIDFVAELNKKFIRL